MNNGTLPGDWHNDEQWYFARWLEESYSGSYSQGGWSIISHEL